MKTIQNGASVQRVDDQTQNNLLRWDGSTVQKVYGRNLTKTKLTSRNNRKKKKGMKNKEMVEHPDHYGGKDNPYEVVKVGFGVLIKTLIFLM